MNTVIVTGGAGFIGSHTCVELFAAGYTPVIVDNFVNSKRWIVDQIAEIAGTRPTVYDGDCRDSEFLTKVFEEVGPVKGVIHFAALKAVGESVQQPLAYYDNNIRSLIVLLETMKRHGTKHIIYSSSATVYGEPKENPIDEGAEIMPAQSPYGATKIICEGILRDVVRSGEDLGVVALRYFNPIGAHSSGTLGELPIGTPNNLVPYITQAAAGIRPPLTVFGNDYPTPDGTCIRDYVHVVDLARAHIASLEYLKHSRAGSMEVFNVGTGSGTSVSELITLFQSVNHVDLPHVFGPRRSGDIPVCFAKNSKITEVLKWRPENSLRDALRDAWHWQRYLKERDAFEKGK